MSMIKVDAEAFESVAFEGGRRLLSCAAADSIYFEVCPKLSQSVDFAQDAASRLLETHGYRLFRFRQDGALEETTSARVGDIRYDNWFAFSDSIRADVFGDGRA